MQKQPPFRSKAFMKFIHDRLKPDYCCVPGCVRLWKQLHHFGRDGGRSMKPSDLYVARLCKKHADQYEVKLNALTRDGRHELAQVFLEDAMYCLEQAVRYAVGF